MLNNIFVSDSLRPIALAIKRVKVLDRTGSARSTWMFSQGFFMLIILSYVVMAVIVTVA